MYKHKVVFGEIRASAKKKTAIAQVRVCLGDSLLLTINSKPLFEYFCDELQHEIVLSAFAPIRYSKFNILAVVRGGGLTSQASAIKLAITKCMLVLGERVRLNYRLQGATTTDARVVERKKYGHAKARRSFQFSKR
ncbi:MAG: uS9 family ribosomal protein [Candidatus Hodgkinia cicadicola]